MTVDERREMRAKTSLTLLGVLVACGLFSSPASAFETKVLSKPSPTWLTDSLKAEIHAAGANGVQVAPEYLNTDCPGVAAPGVSANACIVAPYGCTANFIFTNGGDWRTNPYIGTASHCTDKVGQPVIMQVDTTTLAEVGTVYKRTSTQDPGADFALIQVYPEVAAKWGVNPAIPTGGPQGIYTGCQAGMPVKDYGHGYGVAVAQGKPEPGVSAHWYDDGYGWFGVGAPGDSGSGMTLVTNESAGNFTHIIIFDPDLLFAPGELVGTRTTAILRFLGSGWAQVNADGTTSSDSTTNCGGSVTSGSSGGGGNGGGGNGNGGGKPGGGKGGGKRAATL